MSCLGGSTAAPTHEAVGGPETEDVDAIRAGLADLRLDLGGRVAELERKVQYLEEYLEERLPNAPSSTGDDPELGGGDASVRPSRIPNNFKTPAMIDEESDEAFYEFTVSMWDAGLLLFIHDNQLFDKVILISGILVNLGLQTLMFAVIVYNLLDNDFSEVTVREMLKWRVTYGHSSDNFDAADGQSLARKLCNHEFWSYEGREYEDMYNYLFRTIPGQVLSVLAIILWVLTTVAEYKKCMSQFLSVLHLPRVAYGEQCLKETAQGGSMVVTGITTLARILVCIILILPRVTVAVLLMVAGSKYLAQTVALSDIVLNTVALGFVMEVDENVAEVMLTERLHHMVQKIKPLSCGMPHSSRARVRDIVRYTMIAGMVLFAFLYWVTPFVTNVSSAATALCGGELDFSYSGGTATNPDITLMPTTVIFEEYQPYCPASANQTYQATYYPQFVQQDQSSPMAGGGGVAGAGADTSHDWQENQMLHVLRHAFSADSCGGGKIRTPPKDADLENADWGSQIFDKEAGGTRERGGTFLEGRCDELPGTFLDMLPSGVHPGRDPIMEDCGRFDVSLHERACVEPAHPGVCIWSWEAQACEGTGRPGVFFQSACRSSLWQTCETWEAGFNASHPSKNCEVARHCSPESPRCLQVDGWLEVALSGVNDLAGRATDVREQVSRAFKAAFPHVPDPWVAAHFYVRVVRSACRCEAVWNAPQVDESCVDQAGCAWPPCLDTLRPFCVLATPGCEDDASQGEPPPWTWCVPDCNSTDGVEATEFQCACGGATCEAGASCVAETSTCMTTPPGPTTTLTTTTDSGLCQCAAVWEWPSLSASCVDQVGCAPLPTCDGDSRPWCIVTNPDCRDAVRQSSGIVWAYCDATTTTTTTTAPSCIDIHMDAVDSSGNGCDSYLQDGQRCGLYDSRRFVSRALCCACGGGLPEERDVAACADPREGCVLVFYRLSGVSEDLLLAEVLGANESIADFMNADFQSAGLSNGTYEGPALAVNQVRFNETSVNLTAVDGPSMAS